MKWAIPQGSSYSSTVANRASAYSTAGLSFNFNTQGESTMISRVMYVECQFKLTIVGVPVNGGYLVNDGLSAPRAFPLASITESITVSINGASVSTSYADALTALLRFCGDYNLSEYDLSGTPTMLDNFSDYSAGVGSIRNPLNSYQSSGYEQCRGGFHLDSIEQVDPATGNPAAGNGVDPRRTTILFTVREPLLISPLLYSASNPESALIGCNTISVNMSFSGDLTRIWSHNVGGAGETITNVTLEIGQNSTAIPSLRTTYLNTPLIEEANLPEVAMYDYFRCEVFQNDQNVSLNSGSSQTFVTNAIQLSTVPKSLIVWCAKPRGSKNWEDTDTAFSINSLSLQYLNVSGQFSSMSQHDLYAMSVRNGYRGSFQEWAGFTTNYQSGADVGLSGSFLKIDSTDLALPSNLASGCVANSQLQLTLNITNPSSESRAVSVYVAVISEGVMSITKGSMMTQLAVITQQDILDTRANKAWEEMQPCGSYYGGSFWDKLKSLGKSAMKGLDKALPFVEKALPVVQGLIGEGMTAGKGRRAGANVGGALVGGKALSRAELKRMLE